MSTGLRLKNLSGALFLGAAVLCAGNPAQAQSKPVQTQSKPLLKKTASAKKKPKAPLQPLPSGPTGQPVQQIPLDSIAAVPPQVSYQNNQLTIEAPNSTLADILRAVRRQTGAEIEVPAAPERVVTHLGPGPARDVVAELLNGSRFNYVLLGAPDDGAALTRIVLVAKSGVENMPAAPAPAQNQQANAMPMPVQQQIDQPADMSNDAEQVDDSANNGEDSADQPAEAEQQLPPDQPPPGVKTPQQMLQEMQQRQLQLQQQQPPGQPAIPGPGMVPRPQPQNP